MQSRTTQRKVRCRPYMKRVGMRDAVGAWSLPELCKAYEWPKGLTGGGVIGIVELGGGWSSNDMTMFFQGIGQPVPKITDVSVDGTTNSYQNPPNDADYEVALDIQVAAAAYYLATGKAATVRVYWAQDIGTAAAQAAKDGCAVCSISWGADEASWGKAQLDDMEITAQECTKLGTVLFAAAGDNDSSDGGPNSANVDAPASCPHVIGCGGTRKTATTETVWNDNPNTNNGEGTGGGFSTYFSAQPWQLGAPKAPEGLGRMVPDVAANADPVTGYEIVVYGQAQVVGGTSAVAPLYAGFFAALGKGVKLGFITPALWRNKEWFTDITQGSNGVYDAAAGPDPCSGLGSLIANRIAAIL